MMGAKHFYCINPEQTAEVKNDRNKREELRRHGAEISVTDRVRTTQHETRADPERAGLLNRLVARPAATQSG